MRKQENKSSFNNLVTECESCNLATNLRAEDIVSSFCRYFTTYTCCKGVILD